MSAIFEDLSPAAVLKAMDDNLAAYYLQFGRISGGEVHDDATISWFASGVQDDQFNGVVRADLDQASADVAVEDVLAQFRRRGVPMLWHIGPTTRPEALGATLVAHGLTHEEDEPGMALDLRGMSEDIPVPSGLSVESVSDGAALREWIETWLFRAPEAARLMYQQVYGALGVGPDCPWRCYLGRLAGEPVATVKLFFDSGVVSVQHVATLTHLRRRGIGTAITAHALREARGLGYRIAVLTSSPDGFNSYRRIGFRTYCTYGRYRWQPEAGII